MPKIYKWLPFEEAVIISRYHSKEHGINTKIKWIYFKNKPDNIPFSPDLVYKNSGWVSWAHWLGTNNIRGCLRKYGVNDSFFNLIRNPPTSGGG